MMNGPNDDATPRPAAVVSVADAAAIVLLYRDGTFLVSGRQDIRCSVHGESAECEHVQSPGQDVPLLHVDDIADTVARSEAVRARVEGDR